MKIRIIRGMLADKVTTLLPQNSAEMRIANIISLLDFDNFIFFEAP